MSDCGIVKDLLPLYADNVCSIESKKLVIEHLADCEECQKELDGYELDIKARNAIEKEAVKRFKKKTERRRKSKPLGSIRGLHGSAQLYTPLFAEAVHTRILPRHTPRLYSAVSSTRAPHPEGVPLSASPAGMKLFLLCLCPCSCFCSSCVLGF